MAEGIVSNIELPGHPKSFHFLVLVERPVVVEGSGNSSLGNHLRRRRRPSPPWTRHFDNWPTDDTCAESFLRINDDGPMLAVD